MSSVIAFLGSSLAQNMILTGATILWGVFCKSKWYQESKGTIYQTAVDACKAGVIQTYLEFVSPTTDNNKNKLTPEQAQEARTKALNKASELASTKGIDLIDVLGGQEHAIAMIQSIVKDMKK